ncbi:U-scoloptoxin(19)-Sm1a isoform X2 [Plodia interpunctella]|uniref:U-scoloptoxin(19)-Sm1a isoform X2 n=1 Tax=Plodia interpunctella TaxID=58824 RepID=UPI002368C8E2|nr:U-scoloptoxin(19)-Sm1a isoform X2 [Plodia interpunctella]
MRSLMVILFVCGIALCKKKFKDEDCGVTKFDELAIIDSIYQEPECSSQGGMCVIAEDCTGPLTKQTGLCPNQTVKGVECCHGMSKKETRCRKAGGVCVPMQSICSEKLIFAAARDCFNKKCCIMIRGKHFTPAPPRST